MRILKIQIYVLLLLKLYESKTAQVGDCLHTLDPLSLPKRRQLQTQNIPAREVTVFYTWILHGHSIKQ